MWEFRLQTRQDTSCHVQRSAVEFVGEDQILAPSWNYVICLKGFFFFLNHFCDNSQQTNRRSDVWLRWLIRRRDGTCCRFSCRRTSCVLTFPVQNVLTWWKSDVESQNVNGERHRAAPTPRPDFPFLVPDRSSWGFSAWLNEFCHGSERAGPADINYLTTRSLFLSLSLGSFRMSALVSCVTWHPARNPVCLCL